jgi:hypothetical protein
VLERRGVGFLLLRFGSELAREDLFVCHCWSRVGCSIVVLSRAFDALTDRRWCSYPPFFLSRWIREMNEVRCVPL